MKSLLFKATNSITSAFKQYVDSGLVVRKRCANENGLNLDKLSIFDNCCSL